MDSGAVDARWFLRLEPLMDQTDAFGLLVARLAAIGMQEHMAEKEGGKQAAREAAEGQSVQVTNGGPVTLAYKIVMPQAFVGIYLPSDEMPDLEKLDSVPAGLSFIPMRSTEALAKDIIRFKVKAGRYDIYSKKSAEGLLQKLYRDLSVDNDMPIPARMEYTDEPEFGSMEVYEKSVGRKEGKKMKALRTSLVEREAQRKAARLAIMLVQTEHVPLQAIVPLLKRPTMELADIYTSLEEIAAELGVQNFQKDWVAAEDAKIRDIAERVCEESVSWAGSGKEVRVLADTKVVVRLARHLNSVREKKAEIDEVLGELADNNAKERRRKRVDTSYWMIGKPTPVLSWPLGDSRRARRLLGQAIQKGKRAELARWVSDYLKLQVRMQFNPLGQNRIDLSYAALREMSELERMDIISGPMAYELQLLCDNYEKMCLRLPLQMERARTGEQTLESAWDELTGFMRLRDELVEKIREVIGELDRPDVKTPDSLTLAQASARARLCLSVLAGEVCASDLGQESALIERAKALWGPDWPVGEAAAYLGLMKAHNAWQAGLNAMANDKSNKEMRRGLDSRLKEKISELREIAPIDAQAIESDYHRTQSHVSYKSGENRRLNAYQSEEMRMRKAIVWVDSHIQEMHNTKPEEVKYRDGPEKLRDALSAISNQLFASTGKCAGRLRDVTEMHCMDGIELERQMDQLLFPQYLKSLHYAGLDVRDLKQEMGQLESQDYRQSELPLSVHILVGAHASANIVPMKVFAKEPGNGIAFSQYFEFDLTARMGGNQTGPITPIEEVLYGQRVEADRFKAIYGSIKGPHDYAPMLEYSVLFPNQYYENRLNEEALNNLQVSAQVGKAQALQGKRVLNKGNWEETLPFTVPKGVRLGHLPDICTPESLNNKAVSTLERMHLSHVMLLRMSEMTQNLNSAVNHQTKVMRQRNMLRQKH